MDDAITNLFRPWLLARLLSGVVAAVLCFVAVRVAMKVLRRWKIGASSEGQLLLERRAELVATLVQTGLVVSVMGVALTTLAADRTASSIRGAMCAYGVFDAVPLGFWSLGLSILTAVGCALWLVLHRLDLRLARPTLTQTKFFALLLLAPLVWGDLALFVAFALQLDLSVVATCCSVGLDGSIAEHWGAAGASHGMRSYAFYGAIGLGLAAAASMLWLGRRPGAGAAYSALTLSVLAFGAMIPAVLFYVAPHAYETPRHLCPFCLLHADVGGIGWPLFGTLFVGFVLGAGGGLVQAFKSRSGEPAVAEGMLRKLGNYGALSWALCVSLCLYPVVRFAIVSGGAGLFP